MSFSSKLIKSRRSLWDEMLSHPFLKRISEQQLDDETFNNWLRQDYEFVGSVLPFVSVLKSKVDKKYQRSLTEAEIALHEELDLFEERADSLGVSVEDVPRNLTTQSYIHFLLSVAEREDPPVAFTAYWAAERAYHESWKQVKQELSQEHKWYPFVENWGGEQFANFVSFLEETLNSLSKSASSDQKQRMEEIFTWVVRYEIAFWDMAYGRSGSEWLRTTI
jgi:thiaminase/transcriptional activator TenA